MDQGTRASGQDIDTLRSDIRRTREELGDTVEALAAKTDVKAQARAKVEETKADARARVEQAKAEPQKPLLLAGGIAALIALLVLLRIRRAQDG